MATETARNLYFGVGIFVVLVELLASTRWRGRRAPDAVNPRAAVIQPCSDINFHAAEIFPGAAVKVRFARLSCSACLRFT